MASPLARVATGSYYNNMNTVSIKDAKNRLTELAQFGQSVWLDNIRRDLLTSGALRRMVEQDGLGGVTSNPAIFEKAIVGSKDYTDLLTELQQNKDLDAKAIYEHGENTHSHAAAHH